MESVQKDSLCPAVHFCAAGPSLPHFYSYLCFQWYILLRYVLSSIQYTTGHGPLPIFAPVTTIQVLDFFSVCTVDIPAEKSALLLSTHLYALILRFVLSAMLLILAVTQSLRQLLRMYKATKQWHLNQYMQRLTADGILYFIV